jgi:hypothetical protein
MKRSGLIGILLLTCVAGAVAGAAGPVWIFPMGRLCIAQEPGYAESVLGKWILQGRMKLASPEIVQCARTRNWIPANVCSELMALDSEEKLSRENLERLRVRWKPQVNGFEVASQYLWEASKAEADGRPAPACP